MGEKCTLTNAELHDSVQKWVSKLCDTGGRAWELRVPVNFDRDPDMLITELCKRHKSLLARHNALVEAVKRWAKADDDLLTLWDAMANNKSLEDEYHAARSEVDRLLGEAEG